MRFLSVSAVLLVLAAAQGFAAGEGKAVFDGKCKTCHGVDGKGNPAIIKAMKVTMRPLGSAEVQAKSDADIRKNITEGTGKMKPITGLTPKQTDEVVAYVRTLKK